MRAVPKRRNRKRRRRLAASAAANGPGSDVPAAERGGTVPQGSAGGAASSSPSRRRKTRPRRRRDRAAIAKAKAEEEASKSPRAPVSEILSGKTDAQGDLHDYTTICVPDVISVQGDSSLESGGCLETVDSRCSVSLPRQTTKKSGKKKRRRISKAGNNTSKVNPRDGSASYSLSCENSVGETENLRSKSCKQSDLTCQPENCTVSENADSNMGYQNEAPKCPVRRKANGASGNSKEASPDCRSLQELEEHKEDENGDSINSGNLKEENKKRKKRKRRIRRRKKATSQDRPLSNGADGSGFVVLVTEQNTSCQRDNCTASENTDTNMGYQNEDPKSPVMRKNNLLGSSREASPDYRSFQELEEHKENENGASINFSNKEENKRRKKRKSRNRRNCCKETVSQDCPLSNVAEESGIVLSISEKNTSCHNPVTNSVSVIDAKTKEGENGNLDMYSTIDKSCELGSSTYTERNEFKEQDVACSEDNNANFQSPSNLAVAYAGKLNIAVSPGLSFVGHPKKKLLILDLNGILADINQDSHNAHMAHAKVRGKLVFRRPYCEDFLKFCSWNFNLGIWSSRKKENVASVVDIIMRDFKPHLLFCWDMSKCTFTGFKTLENKHKPLMLKELRKLWNKEDPDLPWEEGDYSPSNTILVDDSPYKALLNPPYTAIFPRPYSYLNWNDNSLGPRGDLRMYLQNLAAADDVQSYVRNNPFGQPFITQCDPSWNFYAQIVDKRHAR